MKARLVGAFVCLFLLGASLLAHAQRLYPVLGPAAEQTPPPLFTAKLTNYLGKSGKITLAIAGGETFQGTWNIVTATFANSRPAADGYPPQPNLAYAWDAVYGPGYFVSTILGSEYVGQATAVGDHGTTLQIEFHREQLGVPEDNHFGVAVDNHGNVYKVVL